MKSKLYRKYHASKYKFPTVIYSGFGNAKGELRVGHKPALQFLEQQLGRKLNVVKTMHTKHEWVFCEARGTAR
ncbi:MAG TPA: hypothetical protein VIY48_16085 [Candidatus Paceibacterota bacterium]